MKMRYISLLVLSLLLLYGCSDNKPVKKKNKILITTTIFPLYDFTREIGKDRIDVEILLPAGADIHAFEPKPKDIININKSNIFIYTSKDLEPWANDLLKGISNKGLTILTVNQTHDSDEHENGDHHHAKDPHIWLDPIRAKDIVKKITETLVEQDPGNKKFYLSNSKTYQNQLDNLHKEIKNTIQKCTFDTIIYVDHFAFGYFTKRYNLKHTSLYKGFSSNSSPTPKSIINMLNTINKSGIKHIYFDSLSTSKTIQLLSKQTNTKPLALHSIHNISLEDKKNNHTYISLMKNNIKNLKIGLEYK